MTVTTSQYSNLDEAYKYFNEKLFEGKLPECLLTLQRKPKMAGYYWHEKFTSRDKKTKISELALNPDDFYGRDEIEILDTLVHEQCHVYQHIFGTPPRKGYHDREFASIMFNIGLQVSSTGEPGGKTTGQSMSDYIIQGGKFESVATAFLLKGNKINWDSHNDPKELKERKKTREKWTCPQCLSQHAWAKKTAKIACGICLVPMIIDGEDE